MHLNEQYKILSERKVVFANRTNGDSIKDLLAQKELIEFSLDVQKNNFHEYLKKTVLDESRLIERLETFWDKIEWKDLSLSDFSKRLYDDSGRVMSIEDVHDLRTLYEYYKSVRKSYQRVKLIKKQIKFLLNLMISEPLIDLREEFTRNHSFHFKNLDDYHSNILVNAS